MYKRQAYVCPHAAIRPVAMTADETANAPEGIKTLPLTGMKDYTFTMTVSALDCTGCGSCANVCPGKKGAKALAMENMEANAGPVSYTHLDDYEEPVVIDEDELDEEVLREMMDEDDREGEELWKKISRRDEQFFYTIILLHISGQ